MMGGSGVEHGLGRTVDSGQWGAETGEEGGHWEEEHSLGRTETVGSTARGGG